MQFSIYKNFVSYNQLKINS